MIKIVATVLLSTLFALPFASGNTGSVSGSCGTTNEFGYFYAYTYQSATVLNDRLLSESHSFIFQGFLAGMESAKVEDFNDTHVIYEKGQYQLAVPYQKGSGLFVKKTSKVVGPGKSADGWIQLCDY